MKTVAPDTSVISEPVAALTVWPSTEITESVLPSSGSVSAPPASGTPAMTLPLAWLSACTSIASSLGSGRSFWPSTWT